MQAHLTAGLLLCGTLYLMRGYAVSRIVVGVTVLLAMVMTMARRFAWRRVMQRRYLEGLETRNVLIVGVGRVAHALRNHLEALRHMGFRFKGFIALDAEDTKPGDIDVVGNLSNCLDVARSMFVDEIFFSTPTDKNAIMALVEEARTAGVDVRVVPDLYEGLAWNAPVEYIGQFPTIPLHRREFPLGAFLIKRVMDVVLSSLGILVLAARDGSDRARGKDEFARADALWREAHWPQGPDVCLLQVPDDGEGRRRAAAGPVIPQRARWDFVQDR